MIEFLSVPGAATFMDWANKEYGTTVSSKASRVVIRTKDPGNPELVGYLKIMALLPMQIKQGLATSAGGWIRS